MLRKMMPPHNRSIKQLAQEEGISEATLFNWRKQTREKGLLLPDGDSGPAGWSARDKFGAVLETAALNEADLAEYCRQKVIYSEVHKFVSFTQFIQSYQINYKNSKKNLEEHTMDMFLNVNYLI